MKIKLPGYDTKYRYGDNLKIDNAMNNLFEVASPYDSGIACLDENGNKIRGYSEKVVFDLSDTMPRDIVDKTREATINVLKAMSAHDSDIKEVVRAFKGFGLGPEKNKKIVECLHSDNFTGLLQLIINEENKSNACEVILEYMFHVYKTSHYDSVNGLITTALANLQKYGEALKALIFSAYNNEQQQTFIKNPKNNEYLFLDDDGEIISFKGNTQISGKLAYITKFNEYDVLTGPNEGKKFSGTNEQSLNYKPIHRPGYRK